MATAARRPRPKIKPPRKHGPDISPEKIWADLSHNIREIQNHNASNLSFEENHRFAYNLVLYKHGDMLYNGVNALIAENLDKLALEEINPTFPSGIMSDPLERSQEGEVLLKSMARVWEDHCSNMVKLGQILKYMDRIHTKAADVPETRESGLNLFLKHIIRPPIKDYAISAILNQLEFERDGYTINRSAVKGCVDVLLSLDAQAGGPTVYKDSVEPVILSETVAYYSKEGERLVQTLDVPSILAKIEDRLESEESRAHHYLSRQTANPIRQILYDTLLTPHLETIISMKGSGLDAMIEPIKAEDLNRLYRLFCKVPQGLPCLKRSVKEAIMRRGKEINLVSLGLDPSEGDTILADSKPTLRIKSLAQVLELALKWVQDVLDLKDKFDAVWTGPFNSDRELESAINQAFESFINQNDKCAEYISLFIDDNLKRGLKGKSDTEIDLVLDKTITVFRYLAEKDVFERYYKAHLSKRLLYGRSLSDDAERGMLAKLKVECGYQFTQKLEGMFHDMKISEETMTGYKKHLSNTTAPEIELSVTVMTSTFWPIVYSSSPCILPPLMVKCCGSFEQFYFSRHSGRRLTWQPSLGYVDLKVRFNKRNHDLNVATFAAVILLVFSDLKDDDFLTYQEVKTATNIDDNDLKRHLQSLACGKFKILKKHPPGRDVGPEDSFSFNADFTSNLQKIKISTVSARVESIEERKDTRDRIDEERRHQMEACIVRIMKDRKHMAHNDLVNEVTRQLAARFQPNPLAIKKRIEGLIEREYLERCDDRKSYNYLA